MSFEEWLYSGWPVAMAKANHVINDVQAQALAYGGPSALVKALDDAMWDLNGKKDPTGSVERSMRLAQDARDPGSVALLGELLDTLRRIRRSFDYPPYQAN